MRGPASTLERSVHPLQSSLYLLLAGNTLWYLAFGAWTKGLDSLAWLVLLMLFAVETGYAKWLDKRHARSLLHLLRFGAAAAIVASAAGYVQQQEWLDAVNIGLWILVVALLECELRFQHLLARRRRLFTNSAIVLYVAIAALIPLWALRGEWLDAYDAALWVCAFALIELDALKLAR